VRTIGFSGFLSVPTPVCGRQDLRPEIVAPPWMRNWWGISDPAVRAWSPVVRVIGEHNDGTVGAWPVVNEPLNAADVLYAVVRPDVLGALAQQVERFLASHALPGSGQVFELERNFAASESIDEEYVQVYSPWRGESPAAEARSDGTSTPRRVGSRPRSGTRDDLPRGGTSASSSRPRRTWPKSTRRHTARLHPLHRADDEPALRREETSPALP
jgi:hypothetical protein